jgi:hypothetical protein
VSIVDEGAALLQGSIERLFASVADGVGTRLERLRAAVRAEVRNAAAALALAIIAAHLVVLALVCAAGSILIAAWQSHPALAAALLATGFLVLALLAVLALRRRTD